MAWRVVIPGDGRNAFIILRDAIDDQLRGDQKYARETDLAQAINKKLMAVFAKVAIDLNKLDSNNDFNPPDGKYESSFYGVSLQFALVRSALGDNQARLISGAAEISD